MGRKEKFSVPEKLNVIEDYLSGKRGICQICREIVISKITFYEWLQKYKMHGAEGLKSVEKNKYYPEAIKVQAVKDYLDGRASQIQICRQYEISSRSILQKWIRKYNGHETFKSHNKQGDRSMTKGRKTTFEERIEIVSFCIANNYNYQVASDKFQVSYQQVYTWIKKYEEHGSESLTDKRGKRKDLEELSETEKLAAQLKLIEAENNRLKMENDYLKKLDEIGRRR
jgi:transposase-like protein